MWMLSLTRRRIARERWPYLYFQFFTRHRCLATYSLSWQRVSTLPHKISPSWQIVSQLTKITHLTKYQPADKKVSQHTENQPAVKKISQLKKNQPAEKKISQLKKNQPAEKKSANWKKINQLEKNQPAEKKISQLEKISQLKKKSASWKKNQPYFPRKFHLLVSILIQNSSQKMTKQTSNQIWPSLSYANFKLKNCVLLRIKKGEIAQDVDCCSFSFGFLVFILVLVYVFGLGIGLEHGLVIGCCRGLLWF